MLRRLLEDEREIGLVEVPKIGERGLADLLRVFGLIEEGEALLRDDPGVRRIAPGPGRCHHRDRAAQVSVGFEDAPDVGELGEEELVVALAADMLEHLIGVDLVEGVVGERQRDVVEVVDDVRLVIGVDIERPQIGPLGLVGDPDVLARRDPQPMSSSGISGTPCGEIGQVHGLILVPDAIDRARGVIGHQERAIRQLCDIDGTAEIGAAASSSQPSAKGVLAVAEPSALTGVNMTRAPTGVERFQDPCWALKMPPRYASGNILPV